jgi:hypothetical protein
MACRPDIVSPGEALPAYSAMHSLFLILVSCVVLPLNIASAHPGPCSDTIAQLEALVEKSMGNRAIRPALQQSLGAQLHHQPTRESVRRAEIVARSQLAAILARAKILDAEGKATECMQSVIEAKRLLDLS